MSKSATEKPTTAPHVHAYGSWGPVLVHTGREAYYPSVRYCECGAKQVKQARDE